MTAPTCSYERLRPAGAALSGAENVLEAAPSDGAEPMILRRRGLRNVRVTRIPVWSNWVVVTSFGAST